MSEDAEGQRRINALLIKVTTPFPFALVHVPALALEECVNFILRNL